MNIPNIETGRVTLGLTVYLSYAIVLITPIAIEFCPKVVNFAVLHPGPFAA